MRLLDFEIGREMGKSEEIIEMFHTYLERIAVEVGLVDIDLCRDRTRFFLYEFFKRQVSEISETPEEYELRIARLSERLDF